MRWHCLQHVPYETPGLIAPWAAGRGHSLTRSELWAGRPLPAQDHHDGLIIFGGPMNVYEEASHPWLADEKRFIADAIGRRKPVLGICLGAQLLSVVLGGAVTRNREREIGYHPVTLDPGVKRRPLLAAWPDEITPLHWHRDRFSLPAGSVRLGRSAACDEQGFIHQDRVVGMQFHLEMTDEIIEALIRRPGGDLDAGPHVHDPATLRRLTAAGAGARRALLESLLDGLSRVG